MGMIRLLSTTRSRANRSRSKRWPSAVDRSLEYFTLRWVWRSTGRIKTSAGAGSIAASAERVLFPEQVEPGFSRFAHEQVKRSGHDLDLKNTPGSTPSLKIANQL
jgi:hypothetical protein